MNDLKQYYLILKHLYMAWYIIPPIVTLIIGILIGSNNPLSSVKEKIIKDAQAALNKAK